MTIASQISPNLFLNDELPLSDLATSPMCINGMKVLAHANEHGGIQLTKSGAFYRKLVAWAAEEFQWPGYEPAELYIVNKVLNEDDMLPLSVMHDLLKDAKLIRHLKGRAVLTRLGKQMLGDHEKLQALLFETFFTKFDFSRHERWPIEFEDADTFRFLGVVKNRLGNWVAGREFAEWCLPVYAMTSARGNPHEDACFHLYIRLLRPLKWLGLADERRPERYTPIEQCQYRKTPLFDKFLRFELALRHSGTVH